MKLIMRVFIAGLVCSGLIYAEASKEVEYLGLFTQEQRSYIVGSGADAVEIKRTITPCAKNKGYFQPLLPAKGVTLIGEAEMLRALNDTKAKIVDMRLENNFLKETIPTAINIPYIAIALRLDELGCEKTDKKWDCTKAPEVYAFCNGPVCGQSPVGIRDMIRLGFPAEKIFYYRGGMLVWDALGLNTVQGAF